MSPLTVEPERSAHPVDLIEQIASAHDWMFERQDADEISISVRGDWCDYHVSFTWMEDMESLHIASAFDLKVPEARRSEVKTLIALINERLWVGHFDQWPDEGLVMFRHALQLPSGMEPSGQQCEKLLGTALDTCERYFTAFQFVVWAGKPAKEALEAAMFETSGEA